ncbi:MAG: hypothetical protein HOJ90_01575, partial [Alphaproteobacteria bacterium]|nr:hypothetical protein [Alphaproteobacteria bacterium]
MRLLKNGDRPFHLGPFPLEVLPHDDGIATGEINRVRIGPDHDRTPHMMLGSALREYRDIFAQVAEGEVAPETAPDTDDPDRSTVDIKGAAYFMDASQVGICLIPDSAWRENESPDGNNLAIVILLEHQRIPQDEPLSESWISNNLVEMAEMRATEIAGNLSGHIRLMGYNARVDLPGSRRLDEERLAVLAGLAVRKRDGTLANPYLDKFTLVVVSTDYTLTCDRPLARNSLGAKGLRYWWGINDAQSGRERYRRAKRPSWASRYPMETVKRIDRPTT